MIIKKGQVISFDIKYGGEPEPEVKWLQGEEVTSFHFLFYLTCFFLLRNLSTHDIALFYIIKHL